MSWTHTTALKQANLAVAQAQENLTSLVLVLRALPEAERPSWTIIGRGLGNSSSSAFSRYGVGAAASLEEARAARLSRSRDARKRAETGQASHEKADLGLSAQAAAKSLGVDPRTVKRVGASVRGRVQRKLVRMPSGRFAERFFLAE